MNVYIVEICCCSQGSCSRNYICRSCYLSIGIRSDSLHFCLGSHGPARPGQVFQLRRVRQELLPEVGDGDAQEDCPHGRRQQVIDLRSQPQSRVSVYRQSLPKFIHV